MQNVFPDLSLATSGVAGWPNDDLLIRDDFRSYLGRAHPHIFPVLDWPELRELFKRHDSMAIPARAKSRFAGGLAIIFGLAGFVIGAIAPLSSVHLPTPRVLGLAAATCTLLSIGLALRHHLNHRISRPWLLHRVWTERLRQLYFQFLLSYVVNSSNQPNATGTQERSFLERRKLALENFVLLMNGQENANFERMISDDCESGCWMVDIITGGQKVEPSEQIKELIRILLRQRIDIQYDYAFRKSLVGGLRSPEALAKIITSSINILTGALVLVSIMLAGELLFFPEFINGGPHLLTISIGGIVGGLLAAVRLADQGYQIRNDAERYRWYLAVVTALRNQAHQSNFQGKLDCLKRMEEASYRELREFCRSHAHARFLG